jgi:hypothetical protein
MEGRLAGAKEIGMSAATTKIALIALYIAVPPHGTPCWAQQSHNVSGCSTLYENYNQIDYGPLKVSVLQGASEIEVGTEKQPGVPRACLVLFTEKDHKLVMSVRADTNGRFELKNVAPGRYRLLARAEGLCTANIPIEIVKSSRRGKARILVHFLARGIDTCSYGELTSAQGKHAPTAH